MTDFVRSSAGGQAPMPVAMSVEQHEVESVIPRSDRAASRASKRRPGATAGSALAIVSMRKALMAGVVSALALAFLMLFTGMAAAAPAQDAAATITSDKVDYAPGSPVTLSGSNWTPGESVHIYVNDDQTNSWTYEADATADAEGVVEHRFNLPNWFVASYTVKATGASGATATTTFTDGNLAFALATSGQAAPANLSWSVDWDHYANETCTNPRDGSGT